MKKVAQQKTELDLIVTRLRTMLRRDSVNAIEKGKLLLRSRKLLPSEHGDWMEWLSKSFDMSYRSAMNYCKAAEYVARKGELLATVANLAPAVLYQLAGKKYTEQEEAEILARAKAGIRIDQNRALAIREQLKPPPAESSPAESSPAESSPAESSPAETPPTESPPDDDDVEGILDGPPPAVPPSAPPAPPEFDLRAFDQAIDTLKRLRTKPSLKFAGTVHSVNDLEGIEAFIRTVVRVRAQVNSDSGNDRNPDAGSAEQTAEKRKQEYAEEEGEAE